MGNGKWVLAVCLSCAAGRAVAQPYEENTTAACRDGVDNDGDGKVDCDDPDCAELSFCHSSGTGSAENTAAACRDQIDNDRDGHTDCEDQDCWDFVFCGEGRRAAPRSEAIHRGPGFRGGASAQPGLLVLTGSGLGVTSTTALGGAGISFRLGYQFKNWVGLYAEPYLSFMGKDQLLMITIAGGLLVQFSVGMVQFSVGPLLGGFATCDTSTNKCAVLKFTGPSGGMISTVSGGFVARVGVDVLQRNRKRGSSAMSLALDFRPLFTVLRTGSTSATSAALGLSFSLGFDAY